MTEIIRLKDTLASLKKICVETTRGIHGPTFNAWIQRVDSTRGFNAWFPRTENTDGKKNQVIGAELQPINH
ncbi:MAG: hypothetical protein MHMPM18_002230 [Marteilia pararefringens]